MIKKLQRRFVLIASVVVFLIISAILLTVNLTMRIVSRNQALQTIDKIAASQDGGQSGGENRQPEEESILNNHYFKVWLDSSGQTVSSDTTHDFKMEDEDVSALTQLALEEGGETQSVKYGGSSYLFKKVSSGSDGGTLIVFLDCSPSVTLLDELLHRTIFTCIISTAIFALLFALLSGSAVKPLAQNIEGQKRFITNASHELKTPIAIIAANTEMIEVMDGESEWTRNTMSQTKKMTKLVEELVVLSKVSELNKVEMKAVDLSAACSESANSIMPLAKQKKKEMRTDITPGVLASGDDKLIRMLTDILLDNAVKYCDEDGSIDVCVSQKGKGRGAQMSVTNDYKNGEGQDYERFFERFYQQDSSHNSKNSGFGIGLSTAQEIVRMMKGTIGVSYGDGRITFRVNLQAPKKA